ncbi:MAG: CHC2 zinc finger domain-containing protein, partial [Planctomycetota bacterium]
MDEWESFKLRVRESSDIAAVVGERLTLRPKGREFVGLCPFHDDNNPSMAVVPAKQIFHCFVCGAGGDVFRFVQRYHGVEFMEALTMLAERGGIDPPARGGPGRERQPGEPAPVGRQQIVGANRAAMEFFKAVLKHGEHGAGARGVLERRGVSPEMIERFSIGAAPDRWDGLKAMAERSDWDVPTLLAAGLLKQRDEGEGRVYDAL